jgi:hypothetical protein
MVVALPMLLVVLLRPPYCLTKLELPSPASCSVCRPSSRAIFCRCPRNAHRTLLCASPTLDHALTTACVMCWMVVSLCMRNPTPQLPTVPCVLRNKAKPDHGRPAVLRCPHLRYIPALARHAAPCPLRRTSHQLATSLSSRPRLRRVRRNAQLLQQTPR